MRFYLKYMFLMSRHGYINILHHDRTGVINIDAILMVVNIKQMWHYES